MDGMTIYEVLEYGPIVFADPDYCVIITVNGSYLNWWSETREGNWVNTECRSGHPDLHTLTVARAMELAEDWFDEVIEGEEDNESDSWE